MDFSFLIVGITILPVKQIARVGGVSAEKSAIPAKMVFCDLCRISWDSVLYYI